MQTFQSLLLFTLGGDRPTTTELYSLSLSIGVREAGVVPAGGGGGMPPVEEGWPPSGKDDDFVREA